MSSPNYQALYRRYRPQRFDEVLGQDHVTKALRNAVRENRVGHAYLFSGPRGTGKTSTARILAKVLNCANPQDGEPCGVCDNCIAVQKGQVTDWFLEQDAASKSKVDDMRDLLDRVPLGTSGNRKVIILDEVHMLSQGAENALLKTLEEPPDHVVFVLATTDPQKVRPTIRSRTQHFNFHLLPPDVMEQHIRHVIADAGLPLADDAVTHVLRAGGGSARDTLSALDQVSALGEVVTDSAPVDAILEALANHDPGAALVAVADAAASGREPRALGDAVIARLRDAFLAVLGVGDEHLPEADRERAKDLGSRIGAAGLTRALEVLGEALTELSRKPDPRVVLEVTLVRLARPDADRSLDAVLQRLERLEQAIASGTPVGPTPSAAPAAPVTPAESPAPQATPAPAPPPKPPAGDGGSGDGGSGGSGPARAARAALAKQLAEQKGQKGGPKPSAPSASVADAGSAPGTSQATATAPAATADASTSDASSAAPGGTPGTSQATATAPAPTATTPADDVAATSVATIVEPEVASSSADPATTSAPPSSDSVATVAGGTSSEPATAPAAGAASTASRATAAAAPDAAPPTSAAPSAGGAGADITKVWNEVLGELPLPVRSKWRGGTWVMPITDPPRFAVPNAWHKKACDEGLRDVEQVLAARLGPGIKVEVVVEGGGDGDAPRPPSGGGGGAPMPPPPPDDEADLGDISELRDAPKTAVGGVDLLLREFGGELLEEDS